MEFIKYSYKSGKVIRLEIHYLYKDIIHIALLSRYPYETEWHWLKTKITDPAFRNGYEIIENQFTDDLIVSERTAELELHAYEMLEHPATQMVLWFKD